MRITCIEISNFRGVDIKIDNLKDNITIIGKNDSGKSNICYAIRKVLDYNIRKKQLNLNDSTNSNGKPIKIKIVLEIENSNNEIFAQLGPYIHENDSKKYVNVILNAKFKREINLYEEEIILGDENQDSVNMEATRFNPIDSVLSIIYINPAYDIKNSQKSYFDFMHEQQINEEQEFSENVRKGIDHLSSAIREEEYIKSIVEKINSPGKFKDIFDDVEFAILPDIQINNIFNRLEFYPINSRDNETYAIGDGKNKILATFLKASAYLPEKEKIIIVEEPENHLYVSLQKYFIQAISSLEPSQMIITTHSPFIVDYNKMNQIVRVYLDNREGNVRNSKTYNIENKDFKMYGYLFNTDFAEMLYNDNVLLVEGDSEKYFYNYLLINDENFKEKFYNKNWGIYCVGGIAFKFTKELLEALNINVYIKTDNDIFSKRNGELYYAGISRCLGLLDENKKSEMMELLGGDEVNKFDRILTITDKESKIIPEIESRMDKICEFLNKNKILFSVHHDGFEKDFMEFIGMEATKAAADIAILRKNKLMNLHEYIYENATKIKISDNNKNSILLSFLGE